MVLIFILNAVFVLVIFLVFSARQHIAYMLSTLYAITHPPVCPFVTRVDHTKMVEVRIMKLSPYGSRIPLVFAG